MIEKTTPRSLEKDDHEVLLIFVGVFIFICGSAWLAKESDVFIGWWKMFYLPQAKAIAWFSTTFMGQLVNMMLGHTTAQAVNLVQFIENASAHQMSGHFCWVASVFLGKYLLFIFMPAACYLTLSTYKTTQGESIVYQRFKNAKAFTKFARKNAFDAHELLERTHKNNFDEQKTKKINAEPLLNNLSLVEFAKTHDLLIKNKKSKTDENILQINIKNTSQCFIEQLGSVFTYMEDLINQPYGWAALKIIQFIPEKYRVKILEESARSHSYDFTVIMSLLESAKQYGVVPSAIFIELKRNYPPLWYGLNNLGRKVVFVEGAGLSAQYAFELLLKKSGNNETNKISKKSKLKKIESAIEGFKEAIKNEGHK